MWTFRRQFLLKSIFLSAYNLLIQMGYLLLILKYLRYNLDTELRTSILITLFDILHFYKIIILTYSKNKYMPKYLENLGFKYIKYF